MFFLFLFNFKDSLVIYETFGEYIKTKAQKQIKIKLNKKLRLWPSSNVMNEVSENLHDGLKERPSLM